MERLSKLLSLKSKDLSIIQNKLSIIDNFNGFWKGSLNISPQILGRLKKTVIITSSGASTRIEGSLLSDSEVEKLLNNINIKKLRDRSSQEVAGYAELTKLIFDEFKNINLTQNNIKHLHSILLKYSNKDEFHKGKYKTLSNAVIAKDMEGKASLVFNPTPPYLVEKEMEDLLSFTNESLRFKKFHPLLIISLFACEFLSIHPFQDGNGRLSRSLTNLFLLKNGFDYIKYVSLEKIIEDNKKDYYLSLRASQKDRKTKAENLNIWINFFLDCLIKQTDLAKNILEKKDIENELSENQLQILNYLKNSKKTLTTQEISINTNINRETVKKILQRLKFLNLAKMQGLGRASRWKSF
ncbi:MAG: filamentation induced by cAMP protein fic [Candidatus Peregrinibacteria bacterium GW2011_GWF2_33_10]|nr:MAG: filamentation induced by cAMP protein fic [Candidatus Peregrinibacteria bacterium GW2011_GWF2_33_10]OGJ44216.1 MAG: hypothetical protein A2263_04550 [Candidatus Peregrinibacteria bacterium RIFOXYA2_FULL_33_21]OGJ46700.1 MAG: hypothetical protein A2272_04810 [Candidatus Peregrinibacteria bacterium RIFOXYA12_FULL_33_12]OGJ51845.1 MAG: hypothetical protein A2307_05215 [Candidatus Peregrinibacteria bacterium RIFOXYB2_FULL_33_20]